MRSYLGLNLVHKVGDTQPTTSIDLIFYKLFLIYLIEHHSWLRTLLTPQISKQLLYLPTETSWFPLKEVYNDASNLMVVVSTQKHGNEANIIVMEVSPRGGVE
ncbi:hypothetical protein Trydic_g23198 [Trypoxylus dichotomus]